MPRTYERKTITKFSQEKLDEVVAEYVGGRMTLRDLEAKYGVPKPTISRWARQSNKPKSFGPCRPTAL